MNRNQTETGDPEDREKYESAVLEFLDKEMAAVQPQKKNDQADELDALVTDLLKQVITESDEKPSSGKHLLIDEEDELFAGLTPSRENPLHAEPAQTEQPPASATSMSGLFVVVAVQRRAIDGKAVMLSRATALWGVSPFAFDSAPCFQTTLRTKR